MSLSYRAAREERGDNGAFARCRRDDRVRLSYLAARENNEGKSGGGNNEAAKKTGKNDTQSNHRHRYVSAEDEPISGISGRLIDLTSVKRCLK